MIAAATWGDGLVFNAFSTNNRMTGLISPAKPLKSRAFWRGTYEPFSRQMCCLLGKWGRNLYLALKLNISVSMRGKISGCVPISMLNFDAGHCFGCTGMHPNGKIDRLHDRIISMNLKDKTGPKSTPSNTNQAWGMGEMPLADVLKLIQQEKWRIYYSIELEYDVLPDPNAVKEVRTCLEYAKAILT